MMRSLIRGCTAFVAVASMALYTGCGEDENETYDVTLTGQNDGMYVGSITGRVISAMDGQSMEGVTVTVTGDIEGNVGASRQVETDSNGYYQFEGLRLGDYLITSVGATGFSGTRTVVTIDPPAGNPVVGTNAVIEVNKSKDISLLPLVASLSGTVLIEKEQPLVKALANRFPAANVVVEVYFDDQIPNRYVDTTNAAGLFSFTNLPANGLAGSMGEIIVRPYVDAQGTSFAMFSTAITLAAGPNSAVPVVLATVTDPLVILKSNIEAIAPNSFVTTGVIKLIASAAIDTTRLTGVTLRRGATVIPATVLASGDTLTVTPIAPLSTSTTYTLAYQLYSRDGRSTGAQTGSFSTVKGIEVVEVSWQETDNSDKPIALTDALVITFNMAPSIDPIETTITLSDNGSAVQTTSVVSASGKTLTVTPSNNLRYNTTYRLAINNLKSGIAGDMLAFNADIRTVASSAPVQAVSGLALDPTTFKADYNTLAVPVLWTRAGDATKYNVYIKNPKHPAWLLLAANRDVGDNFNPTQRHIVSLNAAALDMIINANSAAIEPFALNAACSLMVVPTNEAGLEGAVSTRMAISLKDGVQPVINASFRSWSDAGLTNATLVPNVLTATVEFSEYMNTTTDGTPSLATTVAGVTFTDWVWGAADGVNGKSRATFKVTVPASTSLVGNRIIIGNVSDLSGNSISTAIGIDLL